MLPKLRVLDFQRITRKERIEAKEKYGSELNKEFLKELDHMKIQDKVKLALDRAKTTEEVNQIELLLKTSKLSEELLDQILKQLSF